MKGGNVEGEKVLQNTTLNHFPTTYWLLVNHDLHVLIFFEIILNLKTYPLTLKHFNHIQEILVPINSLSIFLPAPQTLATTEQFSL